MSIYATTDFQIFSGGKSPLNVLVKLFQPTCNGDISAFKDKVMPMAVLLKVVSCMDIKIFKYKVLIYI